MKKVLFTLPLLTLILSWCGSTWDTKEVLQENWDPVVDVKEVEDVVEPKEKEMVEVKEEVIQAKEDVAKKVWSHEDITDFFSTGTFGTNKEVSIDGYDIVLKHKDDIHAGENLTWTITVTQWWNPIDGFEKIDGDIWVWIVRDPVDHDEHVHPLANTNNTLTFSAHTHDAWDYKLITQFQHKWQKVTVPYTMNLIANTEDHHE